MRPCHLEELFDRINKMNRIYRTVFEAGLSIMSIPCNFSVIPSAIDAAVVATGTRVVNVYVLDARVGEETRKMFFQFASVQHF